ncbi:exodeoxyribonuclease VII small subunit [Caldisalinibacter kiritimatiensis]|uniref:Exodeoxyribonuclease 7 small subunit n=1 Tax=Caldisalinibacter kiritimatiensis TaxID=1304284 RepID=R1CSU3_9FIRM|nr:exodeoxyribonuclease VII small subunit [Caldisalinibacter kiritimatiensis]EOD01726.1 Exodeoxyribonuclease VII small subunit [Caldisalinibacter kiritimatiensis]
MNEKNVDFESAIKELEKIVNNLENGELTLEESFKEFQRGVELYKYCNDFINNVEGKVKLLLENETGEVKEIEFLNE